MLRDVISYEWFTVFMVLSLIFITIAKLKYTDRFIDFLGVFGNSKYLKIYTKEQKFIDVFDALLFLNLIFSLSIFGYLSYLTLYATQTFELTVFLKFILGVGSISLIKILVERLIGSIFEIDKVIDAYLFQKISYKNFSGFILLPVNALLLYTLQPSVILIIAVIFLLVIIQIVGFFTSIKNHQKTVINNIFYFILYLCALEIGPYLILYKLIVEYKA